MKITDRLELFAPLVFESNLLHSAVFAKDYPGLKFTFLVSLVDQHKYSPMHPIQSTVTKS